MAFFGHDQHLRRKLYNRYYTTEYVQNSVKHKIRLAFVYVNTTGLYIMYYYSLLSF